MPLKYACGDQACYPGQVKLAKDMGAAERNFRTYLKEVAATGILEIQQRGYFLVEAIFTPPAYPFWGGAAAIGADGWLLGVGSRDLGKTNLYRLYLTIPKGSNQS